MFVPLPGGECSQRGPGWPFAEQSDDVPAMSVSVRQLITHLPAPGGDHCQNEPTTLLEQNLIDIRIQQADLVRHVRNVEFDGATATCFEIDEQQTGRGTEQIAGMRLAVQKLIRGHAAAQGLTGVAQRVEQHEPIASI